MARKNGQKLTPDQLRQNDATAMKLRSEGATLDQIAEALGYADASGALHAVERGRKRYAREPSPERIDLELATLDSLSREAWAVLRRTHYAVNFGRVAQMPNGDPVIDDGPVLAAIDRILKIQVRRAALLGLDAPTKARIEVITEDAIDKACRELEAQIAAAEAISPAAES